MISLYKFSRDLICLLGLLLSFKLDTCMGNLQNLCFYACIMIE